MLCKNHKLFLCPDREGSTLYSNDILSAIQYPDPSTGNPSSSQQVSYTVNALGQNLTMTDRDLGP
jgi:hypothetical protein